MSLNRLTRGLPRKHARLIMGICLGCVGMIALILFGYVFQWEWTGFNASVGPNILQYQPSKTLWDWMQLLIVPLVLAIGAFLFNLTSSRNEQRIALQRDHTAQSIAQDNQRETLLQAYLDRMSELLIHHQLRHSDLHAEVRYIARARTLTVLSRLDGSRKGSLVKFLYESNLVEAINLSGADLSDAHLAEAKLHHVNLSEANLSRAILDLADLSEANLSGANLNRARLISANLSEANLNGATLHQADLREALLSKANLNWADLSEATLQQAGLQETSLHKTTLHRANLERATLCRAELQRANISEANMNGADLTGADLSETDLRGATFIGAILKNVNVQHALYDHEQFEQVENLEED